MASQWNPDIPYIKIEDSPSPEPVEFVPVNGSQSTPIQPSSLLTTVAPAATISIAADATPTIDPRDPEGFLKRCAGFNKKTRVRCNSVIGKKSEQSCHPTFLPTCRAHRDQQSFAGWCQYQANGERCSRLFRWTPPYFELCSEHQGHPDTPCYFMKLPLELRHEVFRYLLPDRPIGSTTAPLHKVDIHPPPPPPPPSVPVVARQPSRAELNRQRQKQKKSASTFPIPLLTLYLVSRQFHQEVKDLLFSTTPFIIDVRKDGTFMCGRRLLEPRRADGSSHFLMDEADEAKQRFLKYFDWCAVKHYMVDILVENGANGSHSTWDEEVELYDIRDYISVVVSGVLAKSRNLCKLNIRLCLANFPWTHEQTLANTKLIVGPFESLRNVRQPQIQSIYMGVPIHNCMLSVQRGRSCSGSLAPICSVPPLPTQIPILVPGMPDFDAYASAWSRWISSSSATALTPKAPIRSMFTAFKDFYSELSSYVPEVTYISGRKAFLHRARVAREQENVEAFRELRNEAIAYWSAYLDREERKKNAMDAKMGRMLDMDIYPSHEWEEPSTSTNANGKRPMPPPSNPGPSKIPKSKTASDIALDNDVKSCDEAISRTHQMMDIMRNQRATSYEQQLQLLEAQSRKRLQMARQERQCQWEQEQEQEELAEQQQAAQKKALEMQRRQREAQAQQGEQQVQYQAQMRARQQKAMEKQVEEQQKAQQGHDNWQIRLSQEMSAGFSGNVPLEERFQPLPSPAESTISPTTITNPSPPIANSTINTQPGPSSVSAQVWPLPSVDTETGPEYHIDETDIACYAHVNLNEEWYTQARNGAGGAGPGPSSERSLKRRVDSGFSEMDFTMEGQGEEGGVWDGEDGIGSEGGNRIEGGEGVEGGYVGKGKGKMGVQEVICID